MRVAYLCTDRGIPYGGSKGAAVHVHELVSVLAAGGAEVLLVVARVATDAPEPPTGVRLAVLPATDSETWLRDRLAEFAPLALYERLALHSAAGSRVARALGIPHLVELNAPLPEEAARYRRLDAPQAAVRLERIVLRGAAAVLPVSRPLADYAARRGARRIEIVPNAVRLDRFPAPRPRRARPPVAVFAGALRPWHGIETIAEAWRMLGRSAPRLLVVGDGPGSDVLRRMGADLAGHVPHDGVPAVLAGCDIGLAPYAPDGPRYFSPLKLFEYLAAGLAAVVADLPGVTDVVGPADAVVIPQGDAAALAAAVAELADDAERRERLGRAGRALVAREHTWELRATRILGLVDELAAVAEVTR